jgi:hypothetical protein
MFAALAENSQLSSQLNVFIALAPVAFLGNIDSIILKCNNRSSANAQTYRIGVQLMYSKELDSTDFCLQQRF